VGWFLDPVFFGDYPASLRQAKGDNLPTFSPKHKQLVLGSLDFVAANAFTAKLVSAKPGGGGNGWRESRVGAATGVPWMTLAPSSQAKMLQYMSKRYKSAVLISSSGTQVPGEEKLRLPEALQDTFRVDYYSAYLDSVCSAVATADVRLIGWYAWSLFDGFEWTDGFQRKFGLVHVAYEPSASVERLSRSPKSSAHWLSQHFFKIGA
jgi:beta-glucosidase